MNRREMLGAEVPAVVSGYDGGVFTLPDPVVRALQAYRTVADALSKVREAAAAPDLPTEARLIDDVVAAARNGEELPDVLEAMAQAEVERLARDRELRVFELATEKLAGFVTGEIQRHGREIIVDHLRPVLEELLEDARKPAAILKDVELSPAVLAAARPAIVKSYKDLEPAHSRYRAVRRAFRALKNLDDRLKAKRDVADQFGIGAGDRFVELRNRDRWPGLVRAPGFEQPGSPWEEMSELEAFIWQLNAGGQFWLPLPEEQDAEYERWGEQLKATRAEKSEGYRRRGVGIVR